VADWDTKIISNLPKEFKGSLPTAEEIEAQLSNLTKPESQITRKKKIDKK